MSLASDFYVDIQQRIDTAMKSNELFLATVSEVSGTKVRIIPVGSTTASAELYGRLAGYSPAVNDIVVCGWLGGKPVVLGQLA